MANVYNETSVHEEPQEDNDWDRNADRPEY